MMCVVDFPTQLKSDWPECVYIFCRLQYLKRTRGVVVCYYVISVYSATTVDESIGFHF